MSDVDSDEDISGEALLAKFRLPSRARANAGRDQQDGQSTSQAIVIDSSSDSSQASMDDVSVDYEGATLPSDKIRRVVANRVVKDEVDVPRTGMRAPLIGSMEIQGESYLVVWKTENKHVKPDDVLSWHSIDAFPRDLLYLVQQYLDEGPGVRRKSNRHSVSMMNDLNASGKRDAPSDGFSDDENDEGFDKTVKVYNGVLKRIGDRFEAEKAPRISKAARLDALNLPLASRRNLNCCKGAINRIRFEARRKLTTIPGPPVTIINTFDTTTIPLNFTFIDGYEAGIGVVIPDPSSYEGCQKCHPNMGQYRGCEYVQRCGCLEYAAVDHESQTADQRLELARRIAAGDNSTHGMKKRFPYTHSKIPDKPPTLGHFYLNDRHAIYECNANCTCGMVCKNRLVQYGRTIPLEIFKTSTRGWGLRSPVPLVRGQFIDTYRGEILTNAETEQREAVGGVQKDSYLYSLDKFLDSELMSEEQILTIDGQFKGGPTRFINHSCEPNCRQFTVSYNKSNPFFYDIAFFALRDIGKGEELTFDYMDNDAEEDDEEQDRQAPRVAEGEAGKRVRCLCGSKKCRMWLWT